MHSFEIEFDETNDKLQKLLSLEEKEKQFKEVESDVLLSRRIIVDGGGI